MYCESDTLTVERNIIALCCARRVEILLGRTFSIQLGTTEGEKERFVAPKRHQIKHLDFFYFLIRDQGVGGSNPLSPTILLLSKYIFVSNLARRTADTSTPMFGAKRSEPSTIHSAIRCVLSNSYGFNPMRPQV